MASGIVGGGGSLSDVYSSAKRILLKARDGIERLERFESSSMDSPDLASSVKRDITEVRSLCSNMDALWRSIPVKSQRDLWRRFLIHYSQISKNTLPLWFLNHVRVVSCNSSMYYSVCVEIASKCG